MPVKSDVIIFKEEFESLFNGFCSLVDLKQATKIPYVIWRDLKAWSRPNSDYEKIRLERNSGAITITAISTIRVSPMAITIEIGDVKSFGWYLCTKYFPEYFLIDTSQESFSRLTTVSVDFGAAIDGTTHAISKLSNTLEELTFKCNMKEEEKTMNFNFDFGPVDSSVRMSLYGMAVKNANGNYVAYDAANGRIMDVDILNFEGANKFIYKMPVATKDVAVGDVVIHMRKPMIVTEVLENNFKVVDVFNGEEKTIVPATSPFGWNFMTKIVSLVNFGQADSANPFGNMLPFLLLSDSKSDDMLPLMLMMNGGAIDTSNPMMLWALTGNRTNDPLMLMALMGGFNPANK